MLKTHTLLLPLLFTLTSCVSEPTKPPKPTPIQKQDIKQHSNRPIPGGINTTKAKDKNVQLAAHFAAKKLGGVLGKVTDARVQIVAGAKYYLTIQLQQGKKYNVVVLQGIGNRGYKLISSNVLQPQPGRVGGLSKANTKSTDIQLAAQFAANKLGGLLGSISDAKVQVVAGKKYYLTIQLQRGDTYQAAVYQDLRGRYKLISSKKI